MYAAATVTASSQPHGMLARSGPNPSSSVQNLAGSRASQRASGTDMPPMIATMIRAVIELGFIGSLPSQYDCTMKLPHSCTAKVRASEMPKIVDHTARRQAIVDVVIRRIEREGLGGVSVRTVARDLRVSPSAVRHYFPTSDEMLASALTAVRLAQADGLPSPENPDSRWSIREAWEQALPLDARRRREAAVWLAAMTAPSSPGIRDVLEEANADLDHLCRVTVEDLGCPAEAAERESKALRAFTDGLALNALAEPAGFTPEVVLDALNTYLARLKSAF
ncbi:hypothetical protein C3E77_14130 [Mycetocola zhujimingii]|nr:hypothetical protein C3E77_14130 [Mycetocola zhujimingii]